MVDHPLKVNWNWTLRTFFFEYTVFHTGWSQNINNFRSERSSPKSSMKDVLRWPVHPTDLCGTTIPLQLNLAEFFTAYCVFALIWVKNLNIYIIFQICPVVTEVVDERRDEGAGTRPPRPLAPLHLPPQGASAQKTSQQGIYFCDIFHKNLLSY